MVLAQSRKTPHLRCFIAKTKRIPLGNLVEAGSKHKAYLFYNK